MAKDREFQWYGDDKLTVQRMYGFRLEELTDADRKRVENKYADMIEMHHRVRQGPLESVDLLMMLCLSVKVSPKKEPAANANA